MSGGASEGVLEERGAGEVGWEEPHEQRGDSIILDKSKQARVCTTYASRSCPCAKSGNSCSAQKEDLIVDAMWGITKRLADTRQ